MQRALMLLQLQNMQRARPCCEQRAPNKAYIRYMYAIQHTAKLHVLRISGESTAAGRRRQPKLTALVVLDVVHNRTTACELSLLIVVVVLQSSGVMKERAPHIAAKPCDGHTHRQYRPYCSQHRAPELSSDWCCVPKTVLADADAAPRTASKTVSPMLARAAVLTSVLTVKTATRHCLITTKHYTPQVVVPMIQWSHSHKSPAMLMYDTSLSYKLIATALDGHEPDTDCTSTAYTHSCLDVQNKSHTPLNATRIRAVTQQSSTYCTCSLRPALEFKTVLPHSS
eukprot:20314-Heterococcus_DN1.PRE.12